MDGPTTPRQNQQIIAALWLFLYGSFSLLTPPLLDGVEALHAETAREVLLHGRWLALFANGVQLAPQPPLVVWSIAGSMRLFGVHAEATRLPLAVFALLLFLLTEFTARTALRSTLGEQRSTRVGLYAGVGLLLSVGAFFATRVPVDAVLPCLWLVAAVLCLWLTEAHEQPRVWPCLGLAAACGLSVLSGGLFAPLLPLSIVLIYLLLTRGPRGALRRLKQMYPLLTVPVLLLTWLTWPVLAVDETPGMGLPFTLRPSALHTYFHALHVAAPAPAEGHAASLLLCWALVAVWALPWSFFLPQVFSLRMKQQKALLLFAVAAVLPLLSAVFSPRHAWSALPALPFLVMLIACVLDREASEAEAMTVPAVLGRAGQRSSMVLTLLCCAAGLVCCVLLLRSQQPLPGVEISTLLLGSADALKHGRIFSLNAMALGLLRRPLGWTAVALLLGPALAWWLRRRYQPHRANIILVAVMLQLMMATQMTLTAVAPLMSSRQLARQIAPLLRPTNVIILNGPYESAASMAFYLNRDNIHLLHGSSGALWTQQVQRNPPRVFETNDSLRLRWSGIERVFLWTDPASVPALPGKVYIVAESGGRQIVSNKANDYE